MTYRAGRQPVAISLFPELYILRPHKRRHIARSAIYVVRIPSDISGAFYAAGKRLIHAVYLPDYYAVCPRIRDHVTHTDHKACTIRKIKDRKVIHPAAVGIKDGKSLAFAKGADLIDRIHRQVIDLIVNFVAYILVISAVFPDDPQADRFVSPDDSSYGFIKDLRIDLILVDNYSAERGDTGTFIEFMKARHTRLRRRQFESFRYFIHVTRIISKQ